MATDRDEEARGLALMERAGREIVAGVERLAARWVVTTVTRMLDAWGGLDASERARVVERAEAVGRDASARVSGELRALFALDPALQRETPLQVVRTLRHDVTAVLAGAGVPEVVRDEYEARAFPDDVYGVVPRSLAELGDDDLGPQLLAWGMGKSLVVRARGGPDRGDAG
ncbi:MAG: hypothetical protein KatS3mg010_2145 [Acidimicrobiia bacterium]|nr:MAG: hypothetical protein KatS3mg010_2145 [Acidimicrobiia bacterium]